MPTSRSAELAAPRARRPADECCWSRCEDCGKTCADFDEDGWCHVWAASCGCVLCDECTTTTTTPGSGRMARQKQRDISSRVRASSRRLPVEKRSARARSSAPRGGPFASVSPARLATWIGEYLADLAATGHRPRTLDTYRKALLRLRPELRAARSDAELLRAIAPLAASTRALYLTAARGFDAWCVETHRTARRALAGHARVKLDRVQPKPFEPAELRQLGPAAAVDPWRGQKRYARLRARVRLLVVLLQETGIRIEDARALRWDDVVLDAGREGLHLRAPKGRASQFVPLLAGPLLVALKAARRRQHVAGGVAGGGYVLGVDDDGARPWSYSAAYAAFRKLAAQAGVVGATPHRMRHSRATELVERGISTHGLQRAMGWAKLDTANCYVRFTDAQLRGELAGLPPRRR
jgi:integrase